MGAALPGMVEPKKIQTIFEAFQAATNLTLKPKKCVIVMTAAMLNADNIAMMRHWLNNVIPAWKDIQITDAPKFLGFLLGPAAGANQSAGKVLKTVHAD